MMNTLMISPWSSLPFIFLLLGLALLPTFWPAAWNKFHLFIITALSMPILIYSAILNIQWVLHSAIEYINFICLLGALYKIGGGLYFHSGRKATALSNFLVLLLGGILSNLVGTLGASMLLIRPFLRSNKGRKYQTHTFIFFIFIVSNCGGLLTPLGDPPLLMGYLSGVPFFWTFKLFPIWLLMIGTLLGLFLMLDLYFFNKDVAFKNQTKLITPIKIIGLWNLVLAVVSAAALVLPQLIPHQYELWQTAVRVFILINVVHWSDKLTPQFAKEANGFSWTPFKEVAIIFAGIFITMIPTLKILEQIAPQLTFLKTPFDYFWVTGFASSLLDNAPTYAVTFSIASGLNETFPLLKLASGKSINDSLLQAISTSAVLFGALTYIGNGPNLLVKAIAESENSPTPSFFKYILWALLILFPVLFIVSFLFFR